MTTLTFVSVGQIMREFRLGGLGVSSSTKPRELIWTLARTGGIEDVSGIGFKPEPEELFEVAVPIDGVVVAKPHSMGNVQFVPDEPLRELVGDLGPDSLRERDEGGDFDLSLVQDPSDRALLRHDYHEAVSSLSAQNYKATIVLCGSLAEALLHIWLQRHNYMTARELDKGVLKSYVERAQDHVSDGFIGDSTLLNMIDEGLREWRNLVHAAVVKRKELSVDEHKAAISLEIVKSLAKNLS